MSTPIPTPFDIVDPPAGPIVPSMTVWILTALALAALLLLRWLMLRRPGNPPVAKLIAALLDEVKRATAQSQTHHLVERSARLTRRIVSTYLPQAIDSLSQREMRSLAASLGASSDERNRSTAAILELLAEIEELAYAPHDHAPEIRPRLAQLGELLDTHVRRHRPR